MEIYLIWNEESLSRSLSADRHVQGTRKSDARQTPHGYLPHREKTTSALRSLSAILPKRKGHVILNPSDVTSIYAGQSAQNEEGARLIIRDGTLWAAELLDYK